MMPIELEALKTKAFSENIKKNRHFREVPVLSNLAEGEGFDVPYISGLVARSVESSLKCSLVVVF